MSPAPSGRACPEPRRWGGRRPGAGAPKGNLNGLKHGLRSKQMKAVVVRWARDPQMRAVLAAYARAGNANQRATTAVALWLRYTGVLGNGAPWPGPAPPRMTQREINMYARSLAKHAIKQMQKNRSRRSF